MELTTDPVVVNVKFLLFLTLKLAIVFFNQIQIHAQTLHLFGEFDTTIKRLGLK